jgi:hypothetical protein
MVRASRAAGEETCRLQLSCITPSFSLGTNTVRPPWYLEHNGVSTMKEKDALVATSRVSARIVEVRGSRVILDADLAEIYGVTTSRLNEQVKRNSDRFPADFMFEITRDETENLRSHFAISSSYGGRRYLPRVFTEHGAIMAASVLNTPLAIEVSVYVVRAFIQLREALATDKDLARKIADLERKYDTQFKVVFDAIRQLMAPPVKPRRKIGFGRDG